MATITQVSRAAVSSRLELTVRGIVLGALITLVFTAANVYLGLKAGLTFASSIPAAVISMAVLRPFRNATIYENNIVQTVASAAGTLSSIIFVLPGLVMVGWWTGFPFWPSFGVCVVGGILGVMYTIPLRRALVTTSDLPYPEGVAAAEVLKVGMGSRALGDSEHEAVESGKAGLLAVVGGSIASAVFYFITKTGIFPQSGEASQYFRIGPSATGFGVGLSLALVGAGHLVGLSVGVAMLAGLVIAWGIATPLLTALHPAGGPAADFATGVWAHQVRFIGAGAIGIAAIWTLANLAAPVWKGLLSSLAASRRMSAGETDALPRTERDIPIGLVTIISVVCLIPLAVLLAAFLSGGVLAGITIPLVLAAIVYTVIAGFLVAAVCGYMAGLIGSSNSPVSGLAILTVLGASLLLLALSGNLGDAAKPALVAFALFVTAVVLCVATIANDNLQDLKTGQLVDATPWRQQVALCAGVLFGAIVIPPVLDLLHVGYGFPGEPHPIAPHGAQTLAAPQATLISTLAKGVIQGSLHWDLLGIGALVGIGIILVDGALRRAGWLRLPPLAVGIGIYLPAATTAAVVVGAIAGSLYNRWARRQRDPRGAAQLGVLLASGLIVGESLAGVLISGVIVATNNPNPLQPPFITDAFVQPSTILGLIAFFIVIPLLYRWMQRVSQGIAR
ncbi:MAG: oligopeptide transporter, OPT family [Candidatus Eremiobacteraeota bacterium]|nr:oligopeptide transporter, OPT family [Candidatus Eremiobacteraeota bacterium]MBV9648340.1 oligopeptide transporter, OPT family [Candidatus Eremiobacteraeota bacterium]